MGSFRFRLLKCSSAVVSIAFFLILSGFVLANITVLQDTLNNATDNVTQKGAAVFWNATISSDGENLSSYVFYTNDSGAWTNYSSGSLNSNETNLTKNITIASTRGSVVCGKFFVNSTDGNYTNTSDSCFTVGNTPPSFPSAIFLNSSIFVRQVLYANASGSTDADNDSITYYYAFYSSGSLVQDYSSNQNYEINQSDAHHNVSVRAISSDNFSNSSYFEVNITVNNSAPIISRSISFSDYSAGHSFNATASCFDADGASDIVNTSINPSVGSCSVLSNSTSDGNFTVIYNCSGPALESSNITITFFDIFWANASSGSSHSYPNHAPVISGMQNITVNYGVSWNYTAIGLDADNDSLSWYSNDSAVSVNSSGFINGTSSLQLIGARTVRISLLDGFSNATADFNYTVIDNSSPGYSSFANNGSGAKVYSAVNWSVSIYDEVNLSSWIFSTNDSGPWQNSSAVSVSGTSANISALEAINSTRGKSVCGKFYFNDTSGNSAETNSSCFTVENTAPSNPFLPSPASKKVGELLTASASGSNDADNDTVTYYYEFYNIQLARVVQNYSANQSYLINSSDAHRTIRIRTLAFDGFSNSTGYAENSSTVESSPPVINSITFLPALFYTDSIVNCSVSAFDADNDSISFTYAWENNGTNITNFSSSSLLNLSVPAYGNRGDNITCKVIPQDPLESGSEKNFSAIVLNSPPTSSVLNSTAVRVSESLNASAGSSSDADNDSLSYSYEFYNLNHSLILQNYSQNFSYSVKQSDAHDSIRIRAVAYDNMSNSSYSEINITVLNTKPLIPDAPSLNSTLVKASDTLRCRNGTYSDLVDGDSLVFSEWYWKVNNGASHNSSQDVVVSSLGAVKGDNITCEFRVFDGYDYSSYSVRSNNTALVINSAPYFSPVPENKTINTSVQFLYDINASDADNEALLYWTNSTLFSINSSTGLINYSPSDSHIGNYSILVRVNDSETSVNSTFFISISDTSAPSYANFSHSPSSVEPNSTVSWSIKLTDPSGLSHYSFSSNSTGIWVSYPFVNISGNNYIISISNYTGLTYRSQVCAYFSFNDTLNNRGNSTLNCVVIATKANGDSCESNEECTSTHCVDSVCRPTDPYLYCGDGSCNNGESCSSCYLDCGNCVGGGGGTGPVQPPLSSGKNYTFNGSTEREINFTNKDIFNFTAAKEVHSIRIKSILNITVTFIVNSTPFEVSINEGGYSDVDANLDGAKDIRIGVIKAYSSSALLKFSELKSAPKNTSGAVSINSTINITKGANASINSSAGSTNQSGKKSFIPKEQIKNWLYAAALLIISLFISISIYTFASVKRKNPKALSELVEYVDKYKRDYSLDAIKMKLIELRFDKDVVDEAIRISRAKEK